MKKLILIFGITLGLANSVNALSVNSVLQNKNEPVIQGYLNGIAQALLFANVKLKADGYPTIFCASDKITHSGELAAEAIRTGAAIYGEDGHPALLAMWGFMEMFPCR